MVQLLKLSAVRNSVAVSERDTFPHLIGVVHLFWLGLDKFIRPLLIINRHWHAIWCVGIGTALFDPIYYLAFAGRSFFLKSTMATTLASPANLICLWWILQRANWIILLQRNITFSESLEQVYEYPSFESVADEDSKPKSGITSTKNPLGSFGMASVLWYNFLSL